MLTSLTGELAALSAAFLWALASVVYAGIRASPLAVNLGKGVVAITLLTLTILVQGDLPQLSNASLVLLLLSGAIGIGFGDSVYLAALRALGARQTLLFEALAPPMAAVLALIFLNEALSIWAWLGMGLTIAGVTWVISERSQQIRDPGADRRRGIIYALLAAIAQASGAVLSRAALAETALSPAWGAFIRLLSGVVVLVVWGLAQGKLKAWMLELRSQTILRRLCLAAFGGTYLGIWLQQISLKYAAAGIAQTLTATSPLFVLPIAIWLGDRISIRAWLGALLAVIGVALLLGLQ
ncbi:MAG: DMT family transporter [Thermosynechococcaceae cyanobacterium]